MVSIWVVYFLNNGVLFSLLALLFPHPLSYLFTQSLEWNDEPTEEQAGIISAPAAANDTSEQSFEKKVDNLVSINEENEWDKLLRVR